MTAIGVRSSAAAKSSILISGRLASPVLLMTRRGGASFLRALPQQVDEVLGVAQIGEIRLDGEHDLVGGEQGAACTQAVHSMRQVEDDRRHAALRDVDHCAKALSSKS